MWVEMSKVISHGGKGWDFSQCLWSPSHKISGSKWFYWENLLKVKEGDLVLHLQGTHPNANFVGYSFAGSDGYETVDRPTIPGRYDFAKSFYRVPLIEFTKFSEPFSLISIVSNREQIFIDYLKNKNLDGYIPPFFVFQNNRVQCLNGAYLSELSVDLARSLFDFDFILSKSIEGSKNSLQMSVKTKNQLGLISKRIGQAEFSRNVRRNFHSKCCFPGCEEDDEHFLIGAHIARWADVPELRGKIENGLCFCLMHDRAFELGYFTIDKDLKIKINRNFNNTDWVIKNLLLYSGQRIKPSRIDPSIDALSFHWKRINL